MLQLELLKCDLSVQTRYLADYTLHVLSLSGRCWIVIGYQQAGHYPNNPIGLHPHGGLMWTEGLNGYTRRVFKCIRAGVDVAKGRSVQC